MLTLEGSLSMSHGNPPLEDCVEAINCYNACNPELTKVDAGCGFCLVFRIVRAPAVASLGSKEHALTDSHHSANNLGRLPSPVTRSVYEGLRPISATYVTGAIPALAARILAASTQARRTAGREEQSKPIVCIGRAQATFNDKLPTGGIISLPGMPSPSRGSAEGSVFQGWPLGPGIDKRSSALMTRPDRAVREVKRDKQDLSRESRRISGDMHSV